MERDDESLAMGRRLEIIIGYKTDGVKKDFADMMGWERSYLSNLLAGKHFGIKAVRRILEACPEINAGWLVSGIGSMFDKDRRLMFHEEILDTAREILDLERYMPVMTDEELMTYGRAVVDAKRLDIPIERWRDWAERLDERKRTLGTKRRGDGQV